MTRFPVDMEAQRLMRAGRFQEALPLAEGAVRGMTVCVPGHSLLASILLRLGRFGDADSVVAGAASLDGDAAAFDGLAYVSLELGQHERANELYRRTIELEPDAPRHWYNLACSERSLGRLVDAERACDRCIAIDGTQYAAYLLRSELRVQAPDANHIEEIAARLECPGLDSRARAHLGYALAKELDDVGRFDEAFRRFEQAARERRSQIRYDVADDERAMRRLADVFPRAARPLAGTRASASAGGSRFIFIVGLPRSGTTLVERILGGLRGVRSNGETHHFSRALSAGSAGGGGDMFERAAGADPGKVRSAYERLAGLRPGDQALIEKQPTNYLYLGAIGRALPSAKLILVRRSPLDSCFAMYRTLFGEAFPFTYDFEELARYYAAYERLTAHWRAAFGESLEEVRYEELVRDPRTTASGLARRLRLGWTDAAIDIQSNSAVSLTASAAQIRRPIYGSSSGRWRNYRHHLRPLIDALRRHGVALPEELGATPP